MQSISHVLPPPIRFRHADEHPFEPNTAPTPIVRFPTKESWLEYLRSLGRSEGPKEYCKYGCGGARAFRKDVPYGHPWFGKAFPCPCAKEHIERLEAEQVEMYRASLTRTEQGWDTVNWIGDDENARRMAQLAIAQGWGLFMFWSAEDVKEQTSGFGSGKSGLLVAVVNESLDKGIKATYQSVPRMLTELRAGFDAGTFEETWEQLLWIKVLALDEMWRNKPTEWAV